MLTRGSLGQNLLLENLALTSATFASAMMNLIRDMIFIIAICYSFWLIYQYGRRFRVLHMPCVERNRVTGLWGGTLDSSQLLVLVFLG